MEYRRLYIAYGSNINLEQMANRCPNSKIIGKEMLKGYELEFRGVATIVPNDKSEVPILIWEIDGRDEHSLDKYEGFPNYYRKELFEIDVNGEKKECMAYLMNNGHISPPMSYYYNVIKQGYEANDMNTSYLRAALEKSVCERSDTLVMIIFGFNLIITSLLILQISPSPLSKHKCPSKIYGFPSFKEFIAFMRTH